MKKRLWLILFALMVVAACDSGAEPGTDELPGDPVCITETDVAGADFLGLSEDEALGLADDLGLDAREVGRDGECLPVTLDLREDRINLEFIEDVVVGAAVY